LVVVGVVLIVHEFCHGLLLRAQKLKTKSVGLLLFLFIPGGFVEPDERELARAPSGKRIRMFAAGPVSNVLISLVFFALLLAVVVPKPGVYVYGVAENYPLENYAENLIGARILAVNGIPIGTVEDYREVIRSTAPGDNAVLSTDRGEFRVALAKSRDDNHGIFGIALRSALPRIHFLNPALMLSVAFAVVFSGGFFSPILYDSLIPWWGVGLLQWLFTLNLGVGLFNLLPAKPLDGGYMIEAALEKRIGRKPASRAVRVLSYLMLVLLVLNIVPNAVRMMR
jgi:membrane-associated protease RseP (regulator of RpoE activity)